MAKNDEALSTWKSLNEELQKDEMTEEECLRLLNIERKGQRRLQFMLRLFGRYNKLRAERERREIAAIASQ